MASKTKKALASIYALGSSKLFISIIIVNVLSIIFSLVHSFVPFNANIYTIVINVLLFGVCLFEIYGALLIYRGCKNSEISARGFSLVYFGTLISAILAVIYYIISIVSVTIPIADGFSESIFVVLFTAFFLVFIIALALPFFIVELKAILYLKDIEKNITVRPKKLIAWFVIELIMLIGGVLTLFITIFNSVPALVADFSALGVVSLVLSSLIHILDIISLSLFVALIAKFNNIIDKLIHKEN